MFNKRQKKMGPLGVKQIGLFILYEGLKKFGVDYTPKTGQHILKMC